MRSASPSTAVRSSLPLSKARRVNSPASAGRRPGSPASASNAAATTARPPCRCSSPRSSPVKLAGPGNHSSRPRSMAWPSRGSSRVRNVALRGGGSLIPPTARSAAPAAGPEMRTTATPARPGAVEGAKMVSAIIVAQAAVRASGARRRLVLGIQHQTSYPAALHKVSLQNLLGLLDGAIVIPDALRIDEHRRAQLAAVETAGLVGAAPHQHADIYSRLAQLPPPLKDTREIGEQR